MDWIASNMFIFTPIRYDDFVLYIWLNPCWFFVFFFQPLVISRGSRHVCGWCRVQNCFCGVSRDPIGRAHFDVIWRKWIIYNLYILPPMDYVEFFIYLVYQFYSCLNCFPASSHISRISPRVWKVPIKALLVWSFSGSYWPSTGLVTCHWTSWWVAWMRLADISVTMSTTVVMRAPQRVERVSVNRIRYILLETNGKLYYIC